MELHASTSRNFRTVKLIKPLLACFRARCGNRRGSLDDDDHDDDHDVINTRPCAVSRSVGCSLNARFNDEDPSSVTRRGIEIILGIGRDCLRAI